MKTIKCSLHNHTVNSDGYFPPEDLLIYLKHAGYDVVAITDHNFLTIPKRIPKDLLFINGIEYWLQNMQIEIVGLSVPVNNPILANAKVAWIPHPKYSIHSISRMVKIILELENVYGLEIYNAGEPQLTSDELQYLTNYDINYYAVDDLHVSSQLKTAWMEMEVKTINEENVLENLKSGNFRIVRP